MKHGGIAHTVGEPVVQVGLERVQHAGPHAADQQRLDIVGAEVAAHGLEVQVQFAGDRAHRQATFAQLMGLVIPLAGVLDPHRVRRPERHDQVHWVAWVKAGVRLADDRLGQAGMVYGDQPLHVPAQVVPQVPPVGNLDRGRRTVTGAVRISAGPVPADHLHPGVGAEPAGEVSGFPTDQHIHRPVTVGQVDQHRAVMVPSAQRELIDTEHSDLPDRGIRQAADHPQQRRTAHRHAQLGSQPGSGPPCQRQPDCRQRTLQADAAAGVPLGQIRYLLDESACPAVDVVTEEPAHRQPEHDRPPRNGKISHPPPIAAMNPGRYPTTPAAPRPT